MAVNVNHAHEFQKRKLFAIGIKRFAIGSATTIEIAKNKRLIIKCHFLGGK
jgi:hypothetical protein